MGAVDMTVCVVIVGHTLLGSEDGPLCRERWQTCSAFSAVVMGSAASTAVALATGWIGGLD
jgi:hypothetical protein